MGVSISEGSIAAALPRAGRIAAALFGGLLLAVATLHSAQKEALVQRFFAADTSPVDRGQLLAESHATVVAFGFFSASTNSSWFQKYGVKRPDRPYL